MSYRLSLEFLCRALDDEFARIAVAALKAWLCS
jgi:hypothetical protein